VLDLSFGKNMSRSCFVGYADCALRCNWFVIYV
jgi:hypothetical protein